MLAKIRLLGLARAETQPAETIDKLRATIELLDKRIEFLEAKRGRLLDEARASFAAGNKHAAAQRLRGRMLYATTVEGIVRSRDKIEQQKTTIEEAIVNADVIQAMKTGAGAMRQMHKRVTADEVERVADRIAEQQDVARELSDAVSGPSDGDGGVDEDELLAEIDAMERQLQRDEPPRAVPVAADRPAVPIAKSASKQLSSGHPPAVAASVADDAPEEGDEINALARQLAVAM